MGHSKGNWSMGRTGGCVVTDNTDGFEISTGHAEVDYYGGALICESVFKSEDAKLIAAAPELLEVAKLILVEMEIRQKAGLGPLTKTLVANAKNAIKKATDEF